MKEGQVLFNGAFNTFFYLWLCCVGHMAKTIQIARGRNEEFFYLTTHSHTQHIFYLWLYGVRHMVKDHGKGPFI